jgi:hypothetical protein
MGKAALRVIPQLKAEAAITSILISQNPTTLIQFCLQNSVGFAVIYLVACMAPNLKTVRYKL